MPVHAVSVVIAVVQFVSYVLLSTSVQYIYYYRRADQLEQWKSQPSKMRVVPLANAAIAPLSAHPPYSADSPSYPSSSSSPQRPFATSTAAAWATSTASSSSTSLWRLFVCWMYPTKWLLFPSLPRVPHRHPYQSLLTTANLTLSAAVAGCVTEAFMCGRSALTSHSHFLPALALPTAFFPTSSHPSLPHVVCTLLLSIVWQCVCEYYWHRMQHLPFFYRHCHKLHHYYQAPQPFDDLMIHPLEAFGYYLILYSPAFLVPQSTLSFILYMSVMGVCGVLDHCGVDIRVLGWYDTREHDEHHRLFNVNYSFPFPFMDRLHGTYRAPTQLPARSTPVAVGGTNS